MARTVNDVDTVYAKIRAAQNACVAAADAAETIEMAGEAVLLNQALGQITDALERAHARLERARLHPEYEEV